MVNVLVVEDEGLVGLNLQKQLVNAGYHVPSVAVSAEEVLRLIELQKPDVILMDVRIQGDRDGIETAEIIRRVSQIPIIFVSALADKNTLERAGKTRPSGYMVKPVSFLSLTSSIEMALQGSAQPPASSTSIFDHSEQRGFRLLADAIPHIVWITGSDGRNLYRNRRFSEFLSGGNGGENWISLLHPDETSAARASWQSALSAQLPFEGEYRLWDSQRREYRWHLARALPVPNEKPHLTRWFGTLTDIHGHKAAAEELELEVRKRTAALSDSLERLSAKEETLRQSLIEKDVLLREIHHRVKNNLQIVSSLLNMQASNMEDRVTVAQLRDSERRVLSMALIHEQLYGNKTMSSIDFSEYVGQLVPRVFATFAHNRLVSYRLNLEPTILTIDRAIPCGLILNELVTNALKYAYPHGNGGEVYVTLACEAQNVTMQVTDQGVGFPLDFDSTNTKTLGLQIIRILTKQIGGTLDLDNSSGASFTIRFPREVRT